MELTLITTRQVFILLLMILAGYACCRLGVFKTSEKSVLSSVLVNLVSPAMILDAYMIDFDPATLHNLLLSFVLSAAAVGLAMVISFLCTRRAAVDERAILWMACTFSNAGYMGFPLIKALYGSEGLLYASGFVTIFNLVFWTFGYAAATGQVDPRKVLRSIVTCPCMLAVAAGLVIYLCRIPIPEILAEPIELIGDMNTPLSMIVIGATIAAANLPEMLRRKSIYWACVVRLVLIPLLQLLLFKALGQSGTVANVVLLLGACPTAATTTVLAIQYGGDQELAAGTVVFSTIVSILVLPVYAFLITAVL